MDLGEFTIYLAENLDLYLIDVAIISIIYFLLFKRYLYGIFDAFLFNYIIVFAFCFANIVFMYQHNLIKDVYLSQFILSQLCFILGYFIFTPYKKKIKSELNVFDEKKVNNQASVTLFLYGSFIFFAPLQLSVYYISGIPLYMESRWETFNTGAGLGAIDRVLDVSRFVFAFALFWKIYTEKANFIKKIAFLLCVLFLLITSVLNGSKMAILDYVYILFFVQISLLGHGNKLASKKILKTQLVFFALSFVGAGIAIITHYIANNVEFSFAADDYTNPIYGFALRFVYSGDIYIMAYPNDSITNLMYFDPFTALFRNIIGMFRIIDWDKLPIDIGFQMYSYHNPYVTVPRGPTAKFDVFGFFFLGYWGGLIFSFLTGLGLSYFINKRFIIGRNFMYYLEYSIIAYYFYLIPINPPVAVSKLFNIILFYYLLKVGVLFCLNLNKNNKYQQN